MTTKPQQPPQPEKTEPAADQAPAPPAQAEARELAVDDLESDEGDDVKGGGIGIAHVCG